MHPVSRSAFGVLIMMVASALPAAAQRYTARQDGDVVKLEDTTRKTSVSIAPSIGNIAFDMSINGQKVLRWPYATLDEFRAKPGLAGIPFLGPFANRLDELAFYANGRRYALDISTVHLRSSIPTHRFAPQHHPRRAPCGCSR